MKIVNKLKENLFAVFVAAAYIIMFVFNVNMGVTSVKNSGYYIKEMLMIMPVVFILTGLLDTWVPREVITKYLGKKSDIRGILFSFVLGAISAGPIYAAFPVCTMLRKKGASVRNIVIILSSWAVIKVPMLLAEMKFLGPKFMGLRWILTVISILIFSWIMGKVIKDSDLPVNAEEKTGLYVEQSACIGCGLCAKKCPELFYMENKKAQIKSEISPDSEKINDAVMSCPVKAINDNQQFKEDKL